jgi:hypothetical protein
MNPEHGNNGPPQANPEELATSTKIDQILQRFQFHDVIKVTKFSRQYIVQDCEADTDNANSTLFFFLKQNIYEDEGEFRYALNYYQRLQRYCKIQLAKNDIIKINQIYYADFKDENYFEIALVMDIGEPDRIDIDMIQSEHITKFLKTVCHLLEDLKKFDSLYHGNICLKNIVLIQNELKLSGFKPIYLHNPKYENWKTQLCRNYNHFRADLFMIGLIWLRFLGARVEEITPKCQSLDDLKLYVKELEESVPVERRIQIITNLLDLDGNPDLNLAEVILQFEEFFVLEEIRNSTAKREEVESEEKNLNVFDLDNASLTDRNGSLRKPDMKSDHLTDNVFNQQIKESEHDQFTLAHHGAKFTPKDPNKHYDIKIDGEFTLCDDDSIAMNHNDNPNFQNMKIEEGMSRPEGLAGVNSEKNLFVLPEKKKENEEVLVSLRNVKSANEVGFEKLQHTNEMLKQRDIKNHRPTQEPDNKQDNFVDVKMSPNHSEKEPIRAIAEENEMSEMRESTPFTPMQIKQITSSRKNLDWDKKLKGAESNRFLKAANKPDWIDHKQSQTKIELNEDQIKKIEEQVKEQISQRKINQKESSVREIQILQKKHEDNLKEAEKLKEKLNELSQRKLQTKKLETQKSDVKVANPKPNTKNEKKVNDKSGKVKVGSSKVETNVKGVANKSQNDSKAKNPFEFSNVKERNQLFTYNLDMENKGISFKKMVTSIKTEKPKEEAKKGSANRDTIKKESNPNKNNLNDLLATKTDSNSDRCEEENNSNSFLDFKQGLKLKSMAEQLKEMLKDNQGIKISHENKTLGNLEMKYLNPIQPLPYEVDIDECLNKMEVVKAIGLYSEFETEFKFLYKIKLQILTQFYSFFKNAKMPKEKCVVLYEILEILSLDNSLDENKEIRQELGLELSKWENEQKDYERSIGILKSDIYDDNLINSEYYYNHLAETFLVVHDQQNAAKFFEKLLNEKVASAFIHFDVTQVFYLIFKIFQLLNQLGKQEKLGKFFLKVLDILKNLKQINTALSLKDNDYDNLVEIYLLNSLRFAKKEKNLNLTNFVIHELISKKLLKVEKLNEVEKKEFSQMILDFDAILKKGKNYCGFKENYIRYMDYAKMLLKTCNLNQENLKTILLTNFERGLFYLKEENYAKSQKIIEKCVNNYIAFFNKKDQFIFKTLFEIGQNLAVKEKFKEAIFYFNKILELDCESQDLRKQTIKELIKLKFWTGAFQESFNLSEDYLGNHFDKTDTNSFWKYKTLQCLNAIKLDQSNFEKCISSLNNKVDEKGKKIFEVYKKMYDNLLKIHEDHHDYKENAAFVTLLEEIAKDSSDLKSNTNKFYDQSLKMYFTFVENITDKKETTYDCFLSNLIDPFLTVSENSDLIMHFFINLNFAICMLVPLFKETIYNHAFRQKLYFSFKKNISKIIIKHRLNEDIKNKNTQEQKKENLQLSNTFQKSIVFQNQNKEASLELLQTVTKNSRKCSCLDQLNKDVNLQSLIKSFLKKIKELLVNEKFEDILTYYNRFEKSLSEKKIDFAKYAFIKQLISYHITRKQTGKIDHYLFQNLLVQMLNADKLCYHDLKLVILLFESFKEVDYINQFIEHLDEKHEHYLKIIAGEIMMNNFNRKFQHLVISTFNKISHNKFYDLENNFFMLNLDIKNYVQPEYPINFKPFNKLRYDVLKNEKYQPIFEKHLNSDDLINFYLRHTVFETIRAIYSSPGDRHNEVIRSFRNQLLSQIIKLKIDDSHLVDLIYHIYLIARVVKFEGNVEISDSFLSVLTFLLDRYNYKMDYQYSRIFIEFAKVFFKNKFFENTIKACRISDSLLKPEDNYHIYEPGYIYAQPLELHQFQILAFFVCAAIELDRLKSYPEILEKLDNFKTEDEVLKFDRSILMSYKNLNCNKMADSMRYLLEAMPKLEKLKLNDDKKKLYTAITDKMSYLLIDKTAQNEAELEEKDQKSRDSILRLYQ